MPCIDGRLAATIRIRTAPGEGRIFENPRMERRTMENESFYTYLLHATAGFGVKRYDGLNLRSEFTLEKTHPGSGVYKQRRHNNAQAFNVPDDLRFVKVHSVTQPSTSGTIAHTPQLRSRLASISAPSCLHCVLALTPTSYASFDSRRAGFFQGTE